MSDAKPELTPEEKLLALIQRDKREEATPPAAVTAVPPAPATAPAASVVPAVVDSAPPASQQAEPPAEKKLKLSAQAERPQVKAPEKSTVAASVPPPRVAEAKAAPVEAVKPAAGTPEKAAPAPKEASAGVDLPRTRVMTVHRGVGGLALVNRVLALVVLVLLVLVVYSVASIRSDVAKEVAAQVANAGSLPLVPLTVTSETVPALDYFLDQVSKRNLFLPIGAPVTTNVVVVGQAGDLKLVGVSVDDSNPEESLAIIRNKVSSKTYFVKVGQNVGDSGFTLAGVLADHVVLKSHKQEVELK